MALLLWVLYAALVVVSRLHLEPSPGNVFHIYKQAAHAWIDGESLYAGGRFHYLPVSALVFLPWTELSFTLGGALWRLLNLAIFAIGVRQLAALVRDGRDRELSTAFLTVSAFAIALSWSAARHGQATLAMGGLMLMALSGIARNRTWSPVVALALAICSKPLAVILLPLVILLQPKQALRYASAVALVLLIPFAFQSAPFVLEQYLQIPETLRAHADSTRIKLFNDAFSWLHLLGLELEAPARFVIRSIVALGVAALSLEAWKLLGSRQAVLLVATFAFSGILLLCPGTESNSYALLAPLMGALFVVSKRDKDVLGQLTLVTAVLLFLVNHRLVGAYPNTALGMVKPLAAMLVVSVALRRTPLWLELSAGFRSASLRPRWRPHKRLPDSGEAVPVKSAEGT